MKINNLEINKTQFMTVETALKFRISTLKDERDNAPTESFKAHASHQITIIQAFCDNLHRAFYNEEDKAKADRLLKIMEEHKL